MVKRIGIALLVLLGLFAAVVATRPAEFHIERSTTIAAPPAVVFPLVNDLHAWTRWSPWEKRDPALAREYAGASAGMGAVYSWTGNADVGAGRMTVTQSTAGERVAIRLEFLKPFEATNQVEFSFRDSGAGTTLVWAMDGHNDFVGKLFSLFIDMDAMVGVDFETGLAALKAAAEADAGKAPALGG